MAGAAAELTRVQREFLEKALAFYEQFAAIRRADPEIRRATAMAYHRVGQIRKALGQNQQADHAYQQALAVWQSLVEDFAGQACDRSDLAETLLGRAVLLGHLGRKTEAEKLDHQSLALAEALVAENPIEPLYRNLLVKGLHILSDHQGNLIQAEASEASHRRAWRSRNLWWPSIPARQPIASSWPSSSGQRA